MSDYFFAMSDARAELAGTNKILEMLIDAIDNDNKMCYDITLNMAREAVQKNNEYLSKEVTA